MAKFRGIVIVDVDAKIPLADRAAYAVAQQDQLKWDFEPAWNIDGLPVRVATPEALPLPGEIQMRLLDKPTMDGALGYHDRLPDGTPIAYIFCGLAKMYGDNWTSIASHEALELSADPFLSRCVQMKDGFWDMEVCFTGDTEITMLNGKSTPIASLVDLKEFWVYSCTVDGKIVPGRGHSARKTGKQREIIEVEIDNGEKIRCTPNHRFLLRDGSYRVASELQTGDSLMPLYRRKEILYGDSDYEQVLQPGSKEWEWTHRIVEPRCPPGYVRHHVDFDRFNNEPYNLQVMHKDAHFKLHGDMTRERNLKWASEGTHPWQRPWSEERKESSRQKMITYNASPEQDEVNRRWHAEAIAEGTHPFQQPRSAEQSQQAREHITAYNKSDAHREVAARVGGETFRKLWQDPDFVAHIKDINGERMTKYADDAEFQSLRRSGHETYLADPARVAAARAKAVENATPEGKLHQAKAIRVWHANLSPEQQAQRRINSQRAMHNRWHEGRGIVNQNCLHCITPNNHKVVAVRPAGYEDVYDFTVDTHHNFALSSGVFVHNCDRVEQDTYSRNSVLLSNFNTPECFEPPTTLAGVKFDFLSLSTEPNQVRPGGYAQKFDPAKGWTSIKNGAVSAYRTHLAGLGMGRVTRRQLLTPRPSFLRRLF